MTNFEIFNATNHEVKVYPMHSCAENRKGQYFLNTSFVEPIKIIPQVSLLSIAESNRQLISFSEIPLFLPSGHSSNVPKLQNYTFYDIIIVSSKYANAALKAFPGSENYDYLDRLFTPINLYSTNPENSQEYTIIGCVGIKKVVNIFTPQYYCLLLAQGATPSRCAIQYAIEFCKESGTIISPNEHQILTNYKENKNKEIPFFETINFLQNQF